MIINEIVLENVGVYRGRHSIRLDPPSTSKPVVLIGALNGGGKTTILDALQLGLYGKAASLSKRGSAGYDEYLRRLINRQVRPEVGASIEIELCYNEGGIERTERIQRSWSSRGGRVAEFSQVLVDGILDPVLSDSWAEHIEELLPSTLARLFFFDGELVSELADLDKSTEMLQTAIHSLLGLDLVEQLTSDLAVFERRQRTSAARGGEHDELVARAEHLSVEVRKHDERLRTLKQEHAAYLVANENAERHLGDVDKRFAVSGGSLLEKRREFASQIEALQARLREEEDNLRDLLAGDLPLLLVEEHLAQLAVTQRNVTQSIRAREFLELISLRDQEILDTLQKRVSGKKTIDVLSQVLADDRKTREHLVHSSGAIAELQPDENDELVALLQGGVQREEQLFLERISTIDRVKSDLLTAQRNVERIPNEDAIAGVRAEREQAQIQVHAARARLNANADAIASAEKERAVLGKKMEATINELEAIELAGKEKDRVLEAARRTKGVLNQFKRVMVERHVVRIEAAIYSCYLALLRKQGLVSRLEIDSITFEVRLFGSSSERLHTDELSAGERQLLAVAMLWGLAKASGRSLPTVIDTPLGRLDRSHRTHLITRYFPRASHQVLLLSTDEEITGTYLRHLQPAIGRSYTLQFDEATQSSQVIAGYQFETGVDDDKKEVQHAGTS